MKEITTICAVMTVILAVSGVAQAEIVRRAQGGVLTNSPGYDWWYGCSPTSAGMIMAYYDRNGYGGHSYDNLVPGGVAELSSFGNPGAIANQAIASTGHQDDFYGASIYGYNTGGGPSLGHGVSGDDVALPHHSFDSLADFMGTSQDSLGSSNGSSWLYNYDDGSRLYAWQMPGLGTADPSLMYGLWEYEQYAGYGYGGLAAQNIYNQHILDWDSHMPLIYIIRRCP